MTFTERKPALTIDIECRIARGQTADMIADLLGIPVAEVNQVWDAMDRAVAAPEVVPAKPFVPGDR